MDTTHSPVMLIAGGTGSIGRVIAAQALAAGWSVVVHGSSEASVQAALDGFGPGYPDGRAAGVCADIRDAGAIARLVEEAAGHHGRLDAVVDCVASGPGVGNLVGEFAATEPGAYLELMELSAVYLERLAFAALPWLKASRGCLVAFVSDAAVYAAPRQALIGAARSAAVGFIRNLAAEVARDGVRAHCVSPSFVLETDPAEKLQRESPQRMDRAAQRAGLGLPTPRDIAPLVLFLCGDGARKITGQVISVNGGLNT